MEFGMFHEFPTLAERSHAAAFDEAFALVDAAEDWGLDALWLAELHFAPERSLLASPLTIAAAVAARTRRIKIGIAVQVLPLCHPLRLAEEAATVDQLSRGRLIFGVGRSGVVATYDALGVPYGESRELFAEALDVMRTAWTRARFSHGGRYWRFENVSVAPSPISSRIRRSAWRRARPRPMP
ncbi:MAG: LLM class flavin-dependent oxidoreductase [Stellaceae bacterium]